MLVSECLRFKLCGQRKLVPAFFPKISKAFRMGNFFMMFQFFRDRSSTSVCVLVDRVTKNYCLRATNGKKNETPDAWVARARV